jgi:hypothetical protein
LSHTKDIVTLIIVIFFFSSASASDEYAGGVWTKTTHPDPQNVAIFYVDQQAVKAIGYGLITGKPAIWYAEGSIREGHLTLKYRYNPNATPDGWELEGTMKLKVSKDGTRMSGSARSLTGAWSGRVEFRRIDLRPS